MILVIFFGIIVAGLITVVADVSTVFLASRELQSVADGAVARAAQKADVDLLYGSTGNNIAPGATVPLTATDVADAVTEYATSPVHRPHECAPGTLHINGATLTGETVELTLTCKVPLPFVKLVDPAEKDGHLISVSAQARLLVR